MQAKVDRPRLSDVPHPGHVTGRLMFDYKPVFAVFLSALGVIVNRKHRPDERKDTTA